MCVLCGTPVTNQCGCPSDGCIVKLDLSCLIYHKNNNSLSNLTALGLSNGATMQLIVEAIDDQLENLKFADFNLPVLKGTYTINTLAQFATAVDTEVGLLRKYLGNQTSDPVTAVNGDYWFRTDLAAANGLKMKLNGLVRTIPTT